MDQVELAIEKEVGSLYVIHSIINGSSKLKVRISDESTGAECIISCIFEYNHTDVSYGNVHIELMIMEVSQKPRSVLLDKYSVLDQERVQSEVVAGIIGVMKRL